MIIQQIITILNDLTQRASSRRGLEQSLYNHSDKVQPQKTSNLGMIIQQIITILNDLTQRASSRRGLEQSLYNHSDKVQPKVLEISVRNQMQWTISVRSDRNLWSTLTGCVISVVRIEMSPSMIVVPSTALPYPALYKNNNQTLGGFGRVFATGMYRSIGHVWNFQT